VASILVCDDQRSICEMLDISLRKDGHRVETVNGGDAAMKKLSSANYEVLISDIKMPQTDGIEVLRFARHSSPETSVILITAVEDYEAAVQAVKGGAFDYIHKGPGLLDELKIAVGRALETLSLQRENFALKRDAATRNSLENMIGKSTAIEKLKSTIRTVAPTGSTVLIYGESGTGKELVARAVHACSPRASGTSRTGSERLARLGDLCLLRRPDDRELSAGARRNRRLINRAAYPRARAGGALPGFRRAVARPCCARMRPGFRRHGDRLHRAFLLSETGSD